MTIYHYSIRVQGVLNIFTCVKMAYLESLDSPTLISRESDWQKNYEIFTLWNWFDGKMGTCGRRSSKQNYVFSLRVILCKSRPVWHCSFHQCKFYVKLVLILEKFCNSWRQSKFWNSEKFSIDFTQFSNFNFIINKS